MPLIAGRLTTMSPSTTVQPDPRAYVRIAAMVREMIASQVLPPGSPAPSIARLCRVPGLGYYVTCRER